MQANWMPSELPSTKKVVYKNVKQLMNAESQVKHPPNAVLYQHIKAPPSMRPPLKISDLSGLPTSYTDPSTKLHFATSAEFNRIKTLPSHIVNGYLGLRGIQPDN